MERRGEDAMTPFSTVLVANRGEIACRVIRSVKSLGYRAVAVYSEADSDALHVRLADLATCIGPAPVKESYLSIDAILAAAKRTGANAVHPGYGFLSENAEFAQACADAGLVFIGPPPDAIAAMGNKSASKRRMIEAKVPTIPGYEGLDQSEAALTTAAHSVGFPLLVKAAAGGGGRGMRLVREAAELASAIRTARDEAENAFGSGELLLERALLEARHVEIQVLGDRHGNVVHLGERDCSIQRRHQKIVEECPSPVVSPELRARMGAAGVAAAKSIRYVGAGTVEFLLDADGAFYFLEMNTRLQVEHPVTEMVTGQDLVALQLRVAAGEPLPFTQEDIRFEGHAIEVRLYAEDPYDAFLPQTGTIERFESGIDGSVEGRVTNGMRIDHGLVVGQAVSPWYDPMLAKLIAWGRDREEARRRLVRLLEDTVLLGSTTNKGFLTDVLSHPTFVSGAATTRFIPAHFAKDGKDHPEAPPVATWVTASAVLLLSQRDREAFVDSLGRPTQWALRARRGSTTFDATVVSKADAVAITVDGTTTTLRIVSRTETELRVLVDDVVRRLRFARVGSLVFIDAEGRTASFEEVPTFTTKRGNVVGDGRILAPMNGRIVSVAAEVGASVTPGTVLVVLEAMKMQHQVLADVGGVVREVLVRPNDQVSPKKLLVQIEPNTDEG